MNYAKYVDPIIGTVGDEKQTSIHGGGKTHPGACFPFGMVQLSPDTTTSGDNGTGYNYCQNTIEGFSFNHMSGIGWYGDLGNLQIMPVTGKTELRSGSNKYIPFKNGSEGWKSSFDHKNETARAGYYSVKLDKYGIFCEATVTKHTGMLRFTYPAGEESGIIFNFSRRIAGKASLQEIETEGSFIKGCIVCDHKDGGFGRGQGKIDYKLYFCLEVSKAPKKTRFFENEEFFEAGLTRAEGSDLHLRMDFDTEENEQILVRCGISYTDLSGAVGNLALECPDFDFEKTAMNAEKEWDNALSCAEAVFEDETDRTLFYTCLYHTLLDPRTAVDADGRYLSADGNAKSADFDYRTMFSGWDVYRSEFPLLTLISPQTVNDEVNSLLSIAEAKNTSFPKWELMGADSGCMVGDPGVIVMADAYLKGIRNFDISKAYGIALASSKAQTELDGRAFGSIRPDSEQYKKNAYVPRSLSSTLEFLMADYTMANLSLALGKTEEHEYFLARCRSYKDNFNPETGFMGPRDENGAFVPTKGRYDTEGCVESNIFQQSWFVPYDVEGLASLMGKERALALLEELFERANFSALWNEDYNHSNEPCHNLTHYFGVLGAPERTQYWTRRVQKEAYRTGAFGFCGNEDVGQLSAWYVLSALGFAQICMGDGKYYINTPLCINSRIKLDRRYHSCSVSDTFTVKCDKSPLEYPYIERVTLNARTVERSYLTYEEITRGGILEIYLTAKDK